MTTRRMRIAWWIPKATNILLEYVIKVNQSHYRPEVPTVKVTVRLHTARTIQRSAPQLLPTTSSRTGAAHRMQ